MNWFKIVVVGLGKLIFILDQRLAIRSVFEQPNLRWCEAAGEVIHRFCSQRITQNLYKHCPNKRVKVLFKNAARHKKHWRYVELLETIKNEKPETHAYIMKV
jgi:hypothetical protein